MKKIIVVSILVLTAITFFAACKKDKESTSSGVTTIPLQTTIQSTIVLGDASYFTVLAGTSVTNTGATTITGDLGLSPGTSVGGFPPGVLNGTLRINDAIANQAKLDLTTAYNDAAGRTATDIVLINGNLGGLTFTPGLYKSTSTVSVSSGDLTFDAKGNSSAIFIIQIASSFSMTSGRKMFLTGGALASNIFWQVGSSATFGTTSVFKGNLMALQSVSFATGATMEGRALARNGGVTMQSNTMVKP